MNLTFSVHQLQYSMKVIHDTLEEQPVPKSFVSKQKASFSLERTVWSLEIDRDRPFLEDRLGRIFHKEIDRDRLKFIDSYRESGNIENRFDTHRVCKMGRLLARDGAAS